MVNSTAFEEAKSNQDASTSGRSRISDQDKFCPLVYFGLKSEESVSKRDRVAFLGTPPQSVMGHLIADQAFGCAVVTAIQQDAKTNLISIILGKL